MDTDNDREVADALTWETIVAMTQGRRPRGNINEVLADFRSATKERCF
jgi:hypothetical protein